MDKPIASTKKTKYLLDKYKIYAKKKFGQNFIIDSNVINNILQLSEINKNDIIIEIGPGLGALTQGLVLFAHHVYAFEIDSTLVNLLNKELNIYHNLTIIASDILKINLKEFIDKLDPNYNVIIVSNLPYYITTEILTKVILAKSRCKKMIVMMQKEVGNKLIKPQEDKQKSILSYLSKYYCNISKLCEVSKNVFIPAPNVDSIVLCFEFKQNLDALVDDEKFVEITKALLSMRRKTIQNNLNNYLQDKEKVIKILEELKIPLTKRAEELELSDFIEISNKICTI